MIPENVRQLAIRIKDDLTWYRVQKKWEEEDFIFLELIQADKPLSTPIELIFDKKEGSNARI